MSGQRHQFSSSTVEEVEQVAIALIVLHNSKPLDTSAEEERCHNYQPVEARRPDARAGVPEPREEDERHRRLEAMPYDRESLLRQNIQRGGQTFLESTDHVYRMLDTAPRYIERTNPRTLEKMIWGHLGIADAARADPSATDISSLNFSERVAIKQLDKEVIERYHKEGGKEDPYQEIEVMILYGDNEKIIKHREIFENDRYLHIVLPFCERGDLCDRIPWHDYRILSRSEGTKKIKVWPLSSSEEGEVNRALDFCNYISTLPHETHNEPMAIHHRDDGWLVNWELCLKILFTALGSKIPLAKLMDILTNFPIKRGGLPEQDAKACFRQIVDILEYLRTNRIAHCDISPENIMFLNGKCIFIDFGMSKVINRNSDNESLVIKSDGFCGKSPYTAPEAYAQEGRIDGHKSDCFAAFMVLYVMLTGCWLYEIPDLSDRNYELFIFRGGLKNEQVNLDFITEEKAKNNGSLENCEEILIRFWAHRQLSNEVKDLLQGVLRHDPNDRLTLDSVRQHRWIAE